MTFSRKNLIWIILVVMGMIVSACVPVAPNISDPVATTVPQTEKTSEELTLFVAAEKIECVGVAPMECLQVRFGEDGETQLFYQGIDGFIFVPGYEYELRVLRTEVENPPADGSSLAYTLLEIVNQAPAYTGEALPLENTEWKLVAFGAESMTPFSPKETEVTALFADGQLSGDSGCNRYTTSYTTDGSQLTLSPIALTRMACPEPAMTVEQGYMDALSSIGDYAIDRNMLTITYAAGQLTFMGAEAMGEEAANPVDQSATATITLPDGHECLFAGTGATLAFDAKRLNYTCSSMDELPFTGLLGDITQESAGMLTVEVVTINRADNGFVLDASQEMTFLAAEITLADGTQCAFAGEGATLAFEGERLNYTCGDPSIGLLGALTQGEAGVWTATKVTLEHSDSGFTIAESEEMAILSIHGAEMQ